MSRVLGALSRLIAFAWLLVCTRAFALDPGTPVVDARVVVERVRAHNPTVRAGLLDVEGARQDVLRLEAQYLPVVLLDGTFTESRTPSPYNASTITEQRRIDVGAELRKHLLWGTDLSLRLSSSIQEFRFPARGGAIMGVPTVVSGRFGPSYGVLAKLALKQPLLRGRGRDVAEAELNAARTSRVGADAKNVRVASEQLRDALRAYYELWYADRALAIQEQSRTMAQRQLADAEARVQTGSLARVEVLTFASQLATREEDVVVAEAERTRAGLELARLMGQDEQPVPGSVSDAALPEPALPAPKLAEEQALARAPELKERAAQLELLEVRARTAGEAQRARLDFDAYVQAQGVGIQALDPALRQFGQFDAVSALVGLSYETPVSRRAERAAQAKARVAVQVAEQELQAARQRVRSEVRKTLTDLVASERRLGLAQQTAALAEQKRVAEEARFRTGGGTALQVLEAENAARAASLRVARAQADRMQGSLNLAHLTGELLSHWSDASAAR